MTLGNNNRCLMALRTVLLVEDSELEATMLAQGLSGAIPRSSVVHCATTTEAETYLFGDPTPALRLNPDLVVLDVKVPPAGGDGLLVKMREHELTKSVPVVMMSSDMADGEVQKLYELGANSYLDKPVDYHEFLRLVGAAARYWLGLNLNVKHGS